VKFPASSSRAGSYIDAGYFSGAAGTAGGKLPVDILAGSPRNLGSERGMKEKE